MKKNTQKFDPFANLILDEEEQLIEQALENDEFVSRPDFEATASRGHLLSQCRRYLPSS